MGYRLQRVDLHRFLATELPLKELGSDLRQQIRHAMQTRAPLEDLAARAIRELLAKGVFRPVGTLRNGSERLPLHALPSSDRAYDLSPLLEATHERPPAEARAPDPPLQEVGQSRPAAEISMAGGNVANSDAWASISAMRTLLRRDWVAYGLEASLAGVIQELRQRFGGSGVQLVLWPERLGISIQEAPEWELILSDAPQRAELLGALSSSGKDPHLEAGQQWFAVWAQQRVVGALGVDVSLSAHIVSEAAGVVSGARVPLFGAG